MTQAELAAEAGVSDDLVGRIENGERARQGRPVVYALARALDAKPAEFVVNMPPDSSRHREAVARELAKAPAVDAELSRAMRDLLAGYAVRAREERELDASRSRPA